MEGLVRSQNSHTHPATARWCPSSTVGGVSEKAGHSRRFKEGAGSHNITLKMSKFPSKITLNPRTGKISNYNKKTSEIIGLPDKDFRETNIKTFQSNYKHT